jgi:hypothetical protein
MGTTKYDQIQNKHNRLRNNFGSLVFLANFQKPINISL